MAKKRVYGEGSITERKDGRWQVSVPGIDGKRRYAYADSEKEAEKLRRQMLADVEQGRVVASRQPFKIHAEEWLETKRRAYKPNTFLHTMYWFESLFLPAFGDVPLNKLSASHIQKLYNRLLDKRTSPNSIRAYHTQLKLCLDAAAKQGKINSNPCGQVDLPKKKKAKNNHLSIEDAHRLIEACQHHKQLSVLVPLALGSEAREGELLALSWDDVDMERGLIKINKTLTVALDTNNKACLQIVPPKSESGIRDIVLPAFAKEALRAHHTRQRKAAMAARKLPPRLVFSGPGDGYLWPSGIREQFAVIVKRLGLDIKFHDLRHTGATLLLESGVSPRVVQERLGHSDIRTTLGTYGHVTKRMEDQASDTLDTLFSEGQHTDSEAI